MQDIYDRKLSIYLTAGQDDEGKDIVKAKSFSNVRLDTTDEELSNFAGEVCGIIIRYTHEIGRGWLSYALINNNDRGKKSWKKHTH